MLIYINNNKNYLAIYDIAFFFKIFLRLICPTFDMAMV